MKKVFLIFTIFLLVMINVNTIGVYAETNDKDDELNNKVILYKDSDLETLLLELEEDAVVILLDIIDDEILRVEYHPEDEEILNEKSTEYGNITDSDNIIEGYIRKNDIVKEQDFKETEPLIIYSNDKGNDDKTEGEVSDETETGDELVEENDHTLQFKTTSISNTPKTFYGIGLKNKTHVYAKPSTSSKSLKSYSQGTLLKYKTYTTDWYEATVKVNGKWETGYIHKSHVEEPTNSPKTLRGIGLKSKTHVYAKPSTSSKGLKSYSQGTLLKYRTYTTDWYEATVKVNGKWKTGYIHKSHVEEPTSSPKTLYGLGLKSKTHVYAKASTSSKSLKSYKIGKKLKYQSFTKDWYEAKVKVKGKYVTGYIHKSHVEEPVDKQKTLRGIGLKNKTHVYAEGSTSSKKLKSYAQGTLLKYKSFSKNWHEAKVKVNGKYVTGFIRKSHVEEPVDKQVTEQGIAQKNKTHVYKGASTSSKKLKSYKQGSVLKYKTFNKNWYEAKVKVNGKYETGFIHRSHVDSTLLEYTDYKITLKKAIDIQRNKTTKFSRAEYEEYMDPSKHDIFQHLRLDTSVGVSASQLNKLLGGVLSGKGKYFVRASKDYGVNEAYLLSHAIHETGNGTSSLSNGNIQVGIISTNKWASFNNSTNESFIVTCKPNSNNVCIWDVKEDNSLSKSKVKNLKKTYNMFGIGARDNIAGALGSVYAYRYEWFSVNDAIIGGGEWIANDYIQNQYKQNTLYKMKWNPYMYDGAEWKQYATDARWAVKQTNNIKKIYNQLDNPLYHYDIAKYR